jgi:hypothetical protein
MKSNLCLSLTTLLLISSISFATSEYKQSGRAKVFKGPEGEVISIVPLDQNTKMLVDAHNTYGINAEKTYVYDFDSINSNVQIPNPRRKADDNSQVIIMNRSDDQWSYSDLLDSKVTKAKTIRLTYSEELSNKVSVPALLKKAQAYKPESTSTTPTEKH